MEVLVAIISAVSAAVSAWFAMDSAKASKEAAKLSADAAKESVLVAKQNLYHAASTALMERLSQINSLKITHYELWPLLEKPFDPNENIHTDEFRGLGHLIFATFKMYEEAYLMHTQKQISDSIYQPWEDRLKADLNRWPRYIKFWDEEITGGFKDAWDENFVILINEIIREIMKEQSKKSAALSPQDINLLTPSVSNYALERMDETRG